MHSLSRAFVVRIGYKTLYCNPRSVLNRFFLKQKFQDIYKLLCVTSYTLKHYRGWEERANLSAVVYL